jgi:cobalt-zinc-cadmium resistance protein CzcA
MLGIPKTKILRSVTKYGMADVTIDFQDGTDIFWARQQGPLGAKLQFDDI